MVGNKTVTIAEMAEKLGVSTATVAKALNGQGRISSATVERVRNLAKEMKYIPNSAARALRTNIKDAVGLLITSDVVNPWYSQLVSLLEAELSKRGLTMLLALGKNDPKKAQHALENFFGGRVGGILAGPVFRPDDLKILQSAIDRQIPLVVFNNLRELPVSSVAIDQRAGAEMAIEHLFRLGHRRIFYLGGPENDSLDNQGTRYAGYTASMNKHGLKPEHFTTKVTIGRRDGFELVNQLLKTHSRAQLPTAFFCHNDDMALGAMLALQQAGLRTPDDISLVGFDDIEESSFSVPGLTTIGGVMHELAAELVSTLTLCKQENTLMKKFIVPKLIVRSSTIQNKNKNGEYHA